MKTRTYSELSRFTTFEDRFEYLNLSGQVGKRTFGFDRWMNQKFYTSQEWRRVRQAVILRDHGCDLGVEGHEIQVALLVHHMNPITSEDIVHGTDVLLDPNQMITTTKNTHNAIHFGDRRFLPRTVVARVPGDTKLW